MCIRRMNQDSFNTVLMPAIKLNFPQSNDIGIGKSFLNLLLIFHSKLLTYVSGNMRSFDLLTAICIGFSV